MRAARTSNTLRHQSRHKKKVASNDHRLTIFARPTWQLFSAAQDRLTETLASMRRHGRISKKLCRLTKCGVAPSSQLIRTADGQLGHDLTAAEDHAGAEGSLFAASRCGAFFASRPVRHKPRNPNSRCQAVIQTTFRTHLRPWSQLPVLCWCRAVKRNHRTWHDNVITAALT